MFNTASTRFRKPPLIDPHIISKTEKFPGKRKTIENKKEKPLPKKLKTVPSMNGLRTNDQGIQKALKNRRSRSKSSVENVVTKEEKAKIAEIRKTKLKEIATKPTAEHNDASKTTKTSKANVKVSGSRGHFLLNDIHTPSCSTVKTTATTSAEQNRTEECRNKVSEDCSNRLFSRGVWNRPTNSRNSSSNSNAENEITEMLMWNTAWLKRDEFEFGRPHVNGAKAIAMRNSFSTYQEYHNVVKPLLLMELWVYIYKEYKVSHRYALSSYF